MMSKSFIDTNILIYAMDRADPVKQRLSRAILQELLDEDRAGVISTQILQEFYVTATKKLNLDSILVKSILHNLENYEVVVVEPDLIEAAVDCSILSRLSFWDALVVVCAESASCDNLLSTDLNHGRIIRGVKVENPFLKSSKPEQFHEQQAAYLNLNPASNLTSVARS